MVTPRSERYQLDDSRSPSFDFDAILSPPTWHADAQCKEHTDVNFFPAKNQDPTAALAICAGCLVRLECLEYALADLNIVGIWAGTSHSDRRRIAKARAEGDES